MAEAEAHIFGEWRGPADPEKAELVEELWVESPLGSGWIAAFRLLPQAGEAVVGELRIFPAEGNKKRDRGQWSAHRLGLRAEAPSGGLTARVVRRVSFEEARATFGDALAKLVEKYGAESPLPPLEPFLSGIRIEKLAEEASRRPGPGGRDDGFYAAVAAYYVRKARSGAKRPVEELASELGRSASHVRQMLATARDRELLTRSTRGRAGGELTEAGKVALTTHGARER